MGTNKRSPIKAAQPRTWDGPDLGPRVPVMERHHDISINRMAEPNVLPPLHSLPHGGGRAGEEDGQGWKMRRGVGLWCRGRSGYPSY